MSSLQPYMDWEANGPSYLTDIDVEEETKSTAEEEVWHVAIAWDDIKTMTLDQLDDAFRLDVIAADTPVWKEGMSGWQPLSVVAGMEDDDDEEEEATVMRPAPILPPRASKAPVPLRAPSPPPRPPSRAPAAPLPRSTAPARSAAPRASAPAPRPSAPAPAPRPSAPAPRAPSVPARPPARNVAPLHAVPSAPIKTQPRMAAPLAPVQTRPRMAAVQPVQSVRPASPVSLAPPSDLAFARSMAPPAFRRAPVRRGSGMAWFFVPLVVTGGLFAAYRNDLLLDAARAVHQEDRYLAAERLLLGVPGFGTPRSVASRGLSTTEASTTETSTVESTDARRDLLKDEPRVTETERVSPPAPVAKTQPVAATPAPAPRAVEPSRPSAPPPVAEARRSAPPERPIAKAAPPPAPARAFVAPAPVAKAAPPPPPVEHTAPASTHHGEVKAAKVVLSETPDDGAPVARNGKGKKGKAAAANNGAMTAAAASFGTVGRHEEPEPAPKPEPKPAPPPKAKAAPPPAPAPEPPPPTSGNSALDDAIRAAVKKKTNAPAAGAKKKQGPNADYDPLNSDL